MLVMFLLEILFIQGVLIILIGISKEKDENVLESKPKYGFSMGPTRSGDNQ